MQQIGRYQITGELGRGAMGIVYRAQDPSIGRTVAIKTIRLSEFTDPNERNRLRDRLLREARSAGVLSHPNIVTVFDVGEEGGNAYIAMQYVDGPTLDNLLVEQPPGRELILSILRQTASALDYAHSKGVIHRDIKPANIMIDEGHTAMITDFGVARLQSQQMTQAGTMLGTPNYMSPEQIKGIPVDGRADQFSLAVIAYELLTGERPFTGDSMPTVIFKIMHEAPIPPRRLNPSLGWPVDTVLNKALSKEPGDRYPTCSELVDALENACRSSGDWRPLAPGAAEALPTMADNPEQSAEAAAAPEAPIMLPPLPPREMRSEEEPAPAIVRAARKASVFILIAGAILLGLWGAQQWFGSRPAETAASTPAPGAQPSSGAPTRSDARSDSGAPASKPAPVPPPAVAEPAPDETVTPRRSERPREAEPAQPTTLHIVTVPPGATVTLDNGSTCTSPCDIPATSPRHTATVTMEGYRRALRIVEPARDPELVVTLEKSTGTLAVRSNPPGASILLNGQPRSERTPAVLRLSPGHYKLEVVLEGQRDVEEVDVKDTVITNVEVNFTK